jgi:hypothetical protein
MKRSLLAVAAVLALGSASAYAQTAGVQPSFNDAPDLTSSVGATDNTQSSASARNNDRQSATARDNDRMSAQYANSSHGATRSDASSDAGSSRGFGAGSEAREPAETLNDSFHYPTSN